eukprot:jgi/Ulvmu1/527/UM001_0535.1
MRSPMHAHGRGRCLRYSKPANAVLPRPPAPVHRARITRLKCKPKDTSDMSMSDFLEMKRKQVNKFKPPAAKNRTSGTAAVLGVDFAMQRSGLAVSTGGLAPRPLQVMKMPYKHVDAAAEMVKVAKANACGTMVVGLPLTPGGSLEDRETDSQVGRRCRNFAQTLAMVAKPHDIRVYMVSERYSTMEAEELLIQSRRNKRAVKERLDAASAVVILEQFFRDKDAALEVTSVFGLKSSAA